MIYLRLAGGLGNQLFQISAGLLLAKSYSTTLNIINNSLASYKTKRDPAYSKLLCLNRSSLISKEPARPLIYFAVNRLRIGRLPLFGIKDVKFRMHPWRRTIRAPIFMDGYFQDCWDEGLVQSAILIIRGLMADAPAPLISIPSSHAVIHIRGGDFLSHSSYNILDYHYYCRCILAASKYGYNYFHVVTDDLPHASTIVNQIHEALPFARFTFHDSRSDLEDFFLIFNAPARIIGNSTFAWWASALSIGSSKTWSPSIFLRNKSRSFRFPGEDIVCLAS